MYKGIQVFHKNKNKKLVVSNTSTKTQLSNAYKQTSMVS